MLFTSGYTDDAGIRQFAEPIDHCRAGFAQRFHFPGVRTAAAFDDRAGVTEARPFARCFAADVSDHRLRDFSIDDQLRQFFFL